jgi:Spx/MgsR family transcriptional regulator
MTLRIHGLTKCSTCHKALAWLEDEGVKYDFTDVKDEPPTAKQIGEWSKAVGGWEKLINRAGYTWRGLPAAETKNLNEARAAKLAVANPSLIRRPLIIHDNGDVTVGFSDKVRAKITG